jgi:protein O-mannosyl-transferase
VIVDRSEADAPTGRPVNDWTTGCRATWIASAALVLLTVAVYWNSLRAPFVFDDVPSIVGNPTIEHLWPLGGPLQPPTHGETVTDRPLLNLSFALDYALGRRNPAVYRGGNIAVHACAGLLVFGLVRRTMKRRLDRGRRSLGREGAKTAFLIALTSAALWLVHPLETESVTYVVQRAESLMTLLLLLVMYAFVRGTESQGRRGWLAVSWLACLLGMATKEVMVVAPVLVACYDRLFLLPTWREVFGRRWRFYAVLGLTWLLLGWLVLHDGITRGGTTANASALAYWATQPGALVTYLARSFWPHPLVFDYGARWAKGAGEVVGPLAIVVAMMAGLAVAWRRAAAVAFVGLCFFLILAPTSIVPGARQTIAEHRMYAALAPLIALVVVTTYRALGRRAALAGVVAVLALAAIAVRRNEDYRSVYSIWNDTALKRPDNRWAHVNVGNTLAEAGRPSDALAHYDIALGLDPTDSITHYDAANALVQLGRLPDAIAHFREALRLDPAYAAARTNLADALFRTGNYEESAALYREILRRDADTAEMHYNLGNALAHQQHFNEAERELTEALRRRSSYPEASYNLGCVYLQTSRPSEAVVQFEASLRLKPADSETHNNLGAALAQLGRIDEAVTHVREAVRLDPANVAAHGALGQLYAYTGHRDDAVAEFRAVLRADPSNRAAQDALQQLGVVR